MNFWTLLIGGAVALYVIKQQSQSAQAQQAQQQTFAPNYDPWSGQNINDYHVTY